MQILTFCIFVSIQYNLVHCHFQKIQFLKLQIKENEFPIKIKKVHQATLFQTLNHNLSHSHGP